MRRGWRGPLTTSTSLPGGTRVAPAVDRPPSAARRRTSGRSDRHDLAGRRRCRRRRHDPVPRSGTAARRADRSRGRDGSTRSPGDDRAGSGRLRAGDLRRRVVRIGGRLAVPRRRALAGLVGLHVRRRGRPAGGERVARRADSVRPVPARRPRHRARAAGRAGVDADARGRRPDIHREPGPGVAEPEVATLVDVRPDFWWAWDPDGSVWLLPAYTFIDTQDRPHTVPAITDEYLVTETPATTVPPTTIADADGRSRLDRRPLRRRCNQGTRRAGPDRCEWSARTASTSSSPTISASPASTSPSKPASSPRSSASARTSASTNSSGSKGTRSAIDSPMPTSLTGMPSSVSTANTMPPLAEPSSLVSTTPVTCEASPNSPRLGEPVLTGGGVDDEQHLGHPAGALLGDAANLAQLVHQVGLGVQAAGGVGEHEVEVAGAGPLDGVEHDGARVAALVAAHDLDTGPLGPRRQLLGGGGAERVGGGQQHPVTRRPAGQRPPCRSSSSCRRR